MSAHRLALLFAAGKDERAQARAELQNLLAAHAGDVRAVAEKLERTEKTVHVWITSWGLRPWLNSTHPPAERARARGGRRRAPADR